MHQQMHPEKNESKGSYGFGQTAGKLDLFLKSDLKDTHFYLQVITVDLCV